MKNKPPGDQLDFLSGLRGLAAIWVVLSHIWIFQFGVVTSDGRWGFLTNWLLYSHLAVDIFIVLSGFCLMLSVARDGYLRGGAITFYKKRARRILPPYFVALFCSIFLWALAEKHALHLSAAAVFANVFLVQDMLLRYDIFDGPLWSVAVEWRIYFLLPVMVLLWKRSGRRMALGISAGFALILSLGIFHFCPQFSFACPWYVFLFALGLCAATIKSGGSGRDFEDDPPRNVLHGRHPGSSLFLTAFAASALALGALLRAYPVTPLGGERFGQAMPVIDVFAGVLTASFLILVNTNWRLPRALLSSRPLVNLGVISYSVYLIHAPLLHTLGTLARSVLQTDRLSPFQFGAFALCDLVITLCLGYGFFLLFERPFLNTKRPAREIAAPAEGDFAPTDQAIAYTADGIPVVLSSGIGRESLEQVVADVRGGE